MNELLKKNILKDRPLLILFISILLIRIIIYWSQRNVVLYPDSSGYINYSFSNLLSGNINGRVPLYPLFLKLCHYFFGEIYLTIVVIIQKIISFVSVYYFYKALSYIFNNKKIIFLITFFYGINYYTISFDTVILTESLAISSMVFYIYLISEIIFNKKFNLIIISIIYTALLPFLRPTFLLIFAMNIVLIIFLFILRREIEVKIIINTVIVAFLCFGSLFSYSYMFSKKYGIFTISDPMPRQQLYNVMINTELYKLSNNQEFVESCEYAKSTDNENWQKMLIVYEKYGIKETSQIVSDIIKNNPVQYIIEYYIPTIKSTMNQSFVGYAEFNYSSNGLLQIIQYGFNSLLLSISDIKLVLMCALFIFSIIFSIIEKIKINKTDIYSIYLCLVGLLIFASTIYGTCAEYHRTAIHIFPVTYIIICYIGNNYIKLCNNIFK